MAEIQASQPLLPTVLPEPSKADGRERLNGFARKVAIAAASCVALSLGIMGIAITTASEDGHVVEFAVGHPNLTDGLGPVPTHGPERVARLVVDPQAMFENYGIVSMPIAYLNFKGFANFCIQTCLFLGSATCLGKSAIIAKGRSPLRFNKMSIGFQVLGQFGVFFGMKSIMMATEPWQGTEQLLLCCLLVSQHSTTITVMTSLANNLIICAFLKTDKSIAHNERGWAKMLVACGMITSIPVWVSMMVGMPYWGAAVAFSYYIFMFNDDNLRKDWKAGKLMFPAVAVGSSVALALCFSHLIWLIMAPTDEHMWFMFAAFVVEFSLPLIALLAILVGLLKEPETLSVMVIAFMSSMSVCYCITISVPASILFFTSDVGYMHAIPTAFWGKKIAIYGEDTFVVPAEQAVNDTANVTQLWLSQFMGFFS